MNFIPDIRNLGGRKAISDIMANHYNKMDSVRAVLNTRKGPRSPPRPIKFPEFKDTLKFSTRSNTQELRKKKQKSNLNQTQMLEHYNNIKHMQRRIHDIGSVMII